ncbi:DUF2974 domain-containing protein [Streptococcus ovuberis]|uniref:DUF2974 domain-containing protein n=1 Tax=Streptococcus ovuberis TaxID=1936207 RepID=A0A7X6MWE9_9STRE|nr:DUF2974 domain-containing protein [Streptococcus ovuberis]NKZ19630.1 DUF2974 domain-containing protein [Streptococcus ovuberis]
MPNLLDYLETSQHDSFYDQPINRLDILALTELSYLPFDHLVAYPFNLEQACRLDELARAFKERFTEGYPPLSLVTKERLKLLERISSSKRFKHIKAFGYINDYNVELQKQFAAICYQFLPQKFLTVFRGTDDTLIGWKEDFYMSFMPEIPAQRSASRYLQKLIKTLPGEYTIAGHSKGGNLAVYASSKQEHFLQEQITAVYSFDAPGLHESTLVSPGFNAIQDKLCTIIPQGSIVGLMLEPPKEAQIVKSNAIGFQQHICFTWEIIGNDFKMVDQLTDDSLQLDQALKNWTSSLTSEELRQFFDLFFDTFIEAGIYRFSDITVNTLDKLQKINSLHKKRTPTERQLMDRIVRLLIETRFQIWKDNQLQSTVQRKEEFLHFLENLSLKNPKSD